MVLSNHFGKQPRRILSTAQGSPTPHRTAMCSSWGNPIDAPWHRLTLPVATQVSDYSSLMANGTPIVPRIGQSVTVFHPLARGRILPRRRGVARWTAETMHSSGWSVFVTVRETPALGEDVGKYPNQKAVFLFWNSPPPGGSLQREHFTENSYTTRKPGNVRSRRRPLGCLFGRHLRVERQSILCKIIRKSPEKDRGVSGVRPIKRSWKVRGSTDDALPLYELNPQPW